MDKVLCSCCNNLVSGRYGEWKSNTYTQQFTCHDCLGTFNEIPTEEIELVLNIVKTSKKEFIQSLISYYKEHNRLSSKQFHALIRCMTRKQLVKYYFGIADIEQLILNIDDLNQKQLQELVKLIETKKYQLKRHEQRILNEYL